MAKWNELPWKTQFLIIAGVGVAVTCTLYFMVYKAIDDQNHRDNETLTAKRDEVDQLRPYQNKLVELARNIETLKQQLELQKRIVPDEKEADTFIQLMQGAAVSAGIEIRRYTAKPASTREYYTEVPFEMEVDGPYYAMLQFFEKVSSLERIINVSDVRMASVQKPQAAKAKKTYQYAAGESVVATCTATTFFSHEVPAASAPAAAAAGKSAVKK